MNTKEIIPFNFNGTNEVRAIVDQQGEPWFVAKEVCAVLGIRNHIAAVSRLDKDEKSGVSIADPHGRIQESFIINEPGLYSLILRSRKPEAKAFKRWVTHEVLPTIRKKGAYVPPQMTESEQLLALAQGVIDLSKQIERDRPKVEAFHKLMDSGQLYRITDAARRLTVGRIKLARHSLFYWWLPM